MTKPADKRGFKRFLANRHGFVGLVTAAFLLPTLTLSLGSAYFSREMINTTRVKQSLDAAAVAGILAPEDTRAELTQAWILANTEPVKTLDVLQTTFEERKHILTVGAVYKLSELYRLGIKHTSLDELHTAMTTSSAEFFYDPVELVISLDASNSQDANRIRELVTRAMANTFLDEDFDPDIKVSLVAYSNLVNLGSEYKHLFKKSSLELSKPGSDYAKFDTYDVQKKPQAVYDAQVKTLEAINPGLVKDLLLNGGPGSAWHYAPVARKPLKGTSRRAIRAFVDDMEQPQEFDLAIGDGRVLWEKLFPEQYRPKPSKVRCPTIEPWSSFVLSASAGDHFKTPQFRHDDARDIAVFPESWWDDPAHKKEATNVKQFWEWYGYADGPLREKSVNEAMVSIYGNAPKMRLLVGSSDRKEILERMKDYGSAWTTGNDEAFAWSYRLVNPNWSEAWRKGQDFPAPYHGRIKKHLLMLLGGPTTGYNGAKEIIPEILERLADNGVQVSIMMPENEYPSDYVVKMFKEGTAKGAHLGSSFTMGSEEDVYNKFVEVAGRIGKIRLTAQTGVKGVKESE